MRKRATMMLTAGAAAVATILLTAAASAAPATVTVTNPNLDGHYTAHSDDTILADETTGAQFECTTNTQNGTNASDASGTILSNTYTIPPDQTVGSVDILKFQNCTSSFGAATVATHTPDKIWLDRFPGTQPDGTTPDDGDGYIENSNGPGSPLATVSVSFCSFDVIGNAPGYYLNEGADGNASGTGELILDHNVSAPSSRGPTGLTATNVSSCFGQVNNGDPLSYDGIYTIDDPMNPSITIS